VQCVVSVNCQLVTVILSERAEFIVIFIVVLNLECLSFAMSVSPEHVVKVSLSTTSARKTMRLVVSIHFHSSF